MWEYPSSYKFLTTDAMFVNYLSTTKTIRKSVLLLLSKTLTKLIIYTYGNHNNSTSIPNQLSDILSIYSSKIASEFLAYNLQQDTFRVYHKV